MSLICLVCLFRKAQRGWEGEGGLVRVDEMDKWIWKWNGTHSFDEPKVGTALLEIDVVHIKASISRGIHGFCEIDAINLVASPPFLLTYIVPSIAQPPKHKAPRTKVANSHRPKWQNIESTETWLKHSTPYAQLYSNSIADVLQLKWHPTSILHVECMNLSTWYVWKHGTGDARMCCLLIFAVITNTR